MTGNLKKREVVGVTRKSRLIAFRLTDLLLILSAQQSDTVVQTLWGFVMSVKRLKYVALWFLFGVTLALSVPACSDAPSAYSSEAISSKVIDSDTKKPLEGVVVVAHWELEVGGPAGVRPIGQLKVMETVTDTEGKFQFPAWGPLRRQQGVLTDKDPRILLFKAGYEYRVLQRPLNSKWSAESWKISLRRTDWVPRVVELRSFKGTEREYASHLSSLHTSIRTVLNGGDCEWKKMPHLMVAIDKQAGIFRHAEIYSPLYSIEDLSDGKCGSPKEVLREFMQ